MKKYYTYVVKKIISIQHLMTIEYLQNLNNFAYPEESHDFYEFVFVEKGEIICKTEKDEYCLVKNNFYLLPPKIKHSYATKEHKNATILIVCFKSKSNILSILEGKNELDEYLQKFPQKILDEAKQTFKFPFEKKLELNDSAKLGSQQLIENYIEELLLRLLQSIIYKTDQIQIVKSNLEIKKSIVAEVKRLLEQNIYNKINLSQISCQTYYSKTYLNQTFKSLTKKTIMQYYQDLKIQEAKKLLKSGQSTTNVAEKLNFESPHYFCKVFKKVTGETISTFKK